MVSKMEMSLESLLIFAVLFKGKPAQDVLPPIKQNHFYVHKCAVFSCEVQSSSLCCSADRHGGALLLGAPSSLILLTLCLKVSRSPAGMKNLSLRFTKAYPPYSYPAPIFV